VINTCATTKVKTRGFYISWTRHEILLGLIINDLNKVFVFIIELEWLWSCGPYRDQYDLYNLNESLSLKSGYKIKQRRSLTSYYLKFPSVVRLTYGDSTHDWRSFESLRINLSDDQCNKGLDWSLVDQGIRTYRIICQWWCGTPFITRDILHPNITGERCDRDKL